MMSFYIILLFCVITIIKIIIFYSLVLVPKQGPMPNGISDTDFAIKIYILYKNILIKKKIELYFQIMCTWCTIYSLYSSNTHELRITCVYTNTV